LVCVSETDTVEKVLKILTEHKITSLPVKNANPLADNQIRGVIDILDLATYAYTKFAKVSELAQDSYPQMEEFNNKKVGDLMNISGRNSWHFIKFDRPVSDLFSMLTNSNIHRVSVVNELNDIIGFISQYKLIHFLHKNKSRLEPALQKLTNQKVAEWITKGPVISINMKSFMIDALRLIWDKNVSGVGVVDDDGKLVANFSASDLKRVHLSPVGMLIKDLYQPIKSFLHIRTSLQDRVNLADLPNPEPKIVTIDDTMETVLDSVIANRIHRVFLIDDQKHPIGVISLRDIIAKFLERCESICCI